MDTPPRAFTGLSVSCVAERSAVFTDGDVLKDCYIGAVKRGFSELYESIRAHRQLWMADGGPVSWWHGKEIRVIPRSTMFYMALADSLLLTPVRLMDMVRLEVAQALRDRSETQAWPADIVRAEMSALEQGDVPYWTTSTVSRDVREASGCILHDVAERTGMECIQQRALSLSAKDLQNQLWCIDTFLRLPNCT